ncbi:hypothetical protein BGZ63DRAFT_383056 [Mariannaea sp. PMI_226]|nr:hypothetical protein BGZ63DRAFT_383056 [Mariannaea sp. PMI_226]
MKVGEFQNAIGVSSRSYGSFMNRTGTWDGEHTDTYYKANAFFKKREIQGLPLKAPKPKKAKTAEGGAKGTTTTTKNAGDLFDVEGVTLDGEDSSSVPIYDTCDEVRKKIRAFLAKDGVTQAAFVREISKTFPAGTESVSPANMRYFLGRKGTAEGNTNAAYYAAYVFFEKKRIKAGKPKTKFREEMEEVHDVWGVDTKQSSRAPIFMSTSSTAFYDKYGKLRIVSRGR